MTSINVSLPKALKEYVQAEVARGAYSTPSEYLRELIREDQKTRAQERLELALLEGLNSGPPVEINKKEWAKKRKRLQLRYRSAKAAGEDETPHRRPAGSRA
jgi:antitoxin ParD1/3/4